MLRNLKLFGMKKTYKSNYGDNLYITPAQYITECLCVVIANKENKQLVPYFWKRSPWNKIFRSQVSTANELLQHYHPEVILIVLRSYKCKNLRSLRAKWLLEPLLKEEQARYNQKQKNISQTEKTSVIQLPRQPVGQTSIFAKLKEQDDK